MVRRYNSFLVRCWTFDGDTWRILIEHLQSGARTHVTVPDDAMDWIRMYCEKPASAMAHRTQDDSGEL
jgi:hypothetical protein